MFQSRNPVSEYASRFSVLALVLVSISAVYSQNHRSSKDIGLIAPIEPKASCCNSNEGEKTLNPMSNAVYESYKLTATYYSLRDDLTTTLMLNNKGPEPLLATPTFYSLAGTRLNIPPITVPAASYIDVDMHVLLAGAADEFKEGSMKIGYAGGNMQMGAQVRMIDTQRKLIWAEQFIYTSKLVSSRLESVWWLPFENSKTRLVVSNTSSQTVTATIETDGTSPQQTTPYQVTLVPWETRVLDIMGDVVGHESGNLHQKGGVSISHTGTAGAVIARIFIAKPNKGYSSSIPFIDPETTESQKWHGAGLRLKIDGDPLDAILVARNTGSEATTINGRIPYTRPNGNMAEVVIPTKNLPARSTRLINLRELIDNANVPNAVKFAGIEVQYAAPHGTVVTSVQSMSSDGEHVFQVPMMDPTKLPSSSGGFPWKADGDFRTLVYIKNETDVARKYTASMIYPGGGYNVGERDIKPGETIVVDFKKLRDEQTPDGLGNIIPLDLEKGQMHWSATGAVAKTLSGRSEQVSPSGGIAGTYACYGCCGDSYDDGWLTPFDEQGWYATYHGFIAVQQNKNCNGQPLPPFQVSASVSWSSNDTSILTVDSQGEAYGAGPGSTTLFASWTTGYWEGALGYCQYVTQTPERFTPVAVNPSITSITPVYGSVGGKISVSIDGAGFTPTTTIVPITGITFSDIERFGTTSIVATFTVAGNATAGNNQVKVMAGERTSNGKDFFVQIPKKARRDEIAGTVTVDPGPGNIVNADGVTIATGVCGAYRNLRYTLVDENGDDLNLGMVEAGIGLTVTEILTNYQSTPSGITPPTAITTTTNNAGKFIDLIAAHQPVPCPPPFNFSLTQKFKVTVGQTVFNLTTTNAIGVGREASGRWTITNSIVTP